MTDQDQRQSPYARTVRSAVGRQRAALSGALQRLETQSDRLGEAASLLLTTLQSGHSVLLAGNGGSAAAAQHFSAEFVGRYRRERPPYAAIALTTDTSILTAIGNDYGFDDVFARQVSGIGHEGDVLIAFSTSGESENLIRATHAAHERGMKVIALTGERPNRLADAADLALLMPTAETPLAQELHTFVTHLLCDIVEDELSRSEGGTS
jgi:D-sedoheptulose 7-phosphate isomerase